jgi:hypothetical protein
LVAFAASAVRPAIYIHYRRPEDKACLVDLVRRLQAQGYTSYAEPERSKEELNTATQVMYFKNNNELRRIEQLHRPFDFVGAGTVG